jgi:hypothetical protein
MHLLKVWKRWSTYPDGLAPRCQCGSEHIKLESFSHGNYLWSNRRQSVAATATRVRHLALNGATVRGANRRLVYRSVECAGAGLML